jgi:hypothetical protein
MELTQEYLREIFDYDPETGILRWKIRPANRVSIGDEVGTLHHTGYREVMLSGKHYQIHRLIWAYVEGQIQSNLEIDHINNIRNDNRWENLRLCTRQENTKNRLKYSNNTSGYKGSSYHIGKGKYESNIGVSGKLRYLGSYNTPEEAHEAYCRASELYHGEFGRTE